MSGSYKLKNENLAQHYVFLLGKVSAEQLDHCDGIHQAFELEMDMVNKGTYCRMWQLHIVSNMLGQSVYSWFPYVDVPSLKWTIIS